MSLATPAAAPSVATRAAGEARAVATIVLGGSGYVAGEVLRLVAGHPQLRLAGAVSESQPGTAIDAVFPHLAGSFGGAAFAAREDLERLLASGDGEPVAVFCAAPHGAAAAQVDALLGAADARGVPVRLVDLSADFRFPTAEAYAAVYEHPHGAPARLGEFRCGLPEHLPGVPSERMAHPGCFTTSVLLAVVPLLAAGVIAPEIHVVGITGSTGAGRTPTPTTHHPERRSTVFAYQPLQHRHAAEMRALAAAASGTEPNVHFVPQAGPFARGIHATIQARLARPATSHELAAILRRAYAGAPFVDVLDAPPRLQDVVASNRCRLFAAADREAVAVMSVIDNLVKGAAGGAVQWMNRMLGLAETAGLDRPGPGWL